MGKLFNIRLPKIRITGKGMRLVKPGGSVGGKGFRVNLGSRGLSVTVRSRGASYNTRRGCLLNPFGFLFRKRR